MTNEVIWEEDSDGVVLAWFFDAGEKVNEGDILVEVMVDKIQYEIASPGDGVLQIDKVVDSPVIKGDVLGRLA